MVVGGLSEFAWWREIVWLECASIKQMIIQGVNMCLETESIGCESPDAVCLQAQLKQQESEGGMMEAGAELWVGVRGNGGAI